MKKIIILKFEKSHLIFDSTKGFSLVYNHKHLYAKTSMFSSSLVMLITLPCQCQPAVRWLSNLFFHLFQTSISYFLKWQLVFPILSLQHNLPSISVFTALLFSPILLSIALCWFSIFTDSLLTLLPSHLSFLPFSQCSFSPCVLCYSETWRYFSRQGLPCMAFLHSNANNVGQLWPSMRLCLCLQEHIQRHIVSGEIWVSQRSVPSGTASSR